MNEINFEEAIRVANVDNIILKRRENNLLLSEQQINILKRNDINYMDYTNIHLLLFDIEEILNSDYDEELDSVSRDIQEYIYYNETKK